MAGPNQACLMRSHSGGPTTSGSTPLFAAVACSSAALLDEQANAPMLIINGADDVHVPQTDTLVFQGRPDTEVHLIPGTGHCAASKLLQVMQIVISWLPGRLAGSG
jgi:esterase FrsA